jgi:hypothetical protein
MNLAQRLRAQEPHIIIRIKEWSKWNINREPGSSGPKQIAS